MELGYLGPSGTFTEQAALKLKDEYDLVAFNSIYDVAVNVSNGVVGAGIVPIENSTEGTVNTTVDSIIFDFDIYIKAKLRLPVVHNLIARNKDVKVTRILSHPQAIAQCRGFLYKNFKEVEIYNTSSTAEAVRIVSESSEGWAAIGPENSAGIYNMSVIYNSINDYDDNITEFAVISKDNTWELVSGHASSIAFSTLNKPGQLYMLLDIFSIWDINMTRIISRPMRRKTGEYVFFADLEVSDVKDFNDAMTMVKRKTSFFKLLGCYPTVNYH